VLYAANCSVSIPAFDSSDFIQCPIVCGLAGPYGLIVDINSCLLFSSLRFLVIYKYSSTQDATHRPGIALKNGRYSSGWKEPGFNVLINSGIFILIPVGDFSIFVILIKDKVCCLRAIDNANSVVSFSVASFSFR